MVSENCWVVWGENPHVGVGVRTVTSEQLLPDPERPGSSFSEPACVSDSMQQVPDLTGLQSSPRGAAAASRLPQAPPHPHGPGS